MLAGLGKHWPLYFCVSLLLWVWVLACGFSEVGGRGTHMGSVEPMDPCTILWGLEVFVIFLKKRMQLLLPRF